MTGIDLKKTLINKISEIDDISFLEAIHTILDTKLNDKVWFLSDEQKQAIFESQEEISNGNFILASELDEEVEE